MSKRWALLIIMKICVVSSHCARWIITSGWMNHCIVSLFSVIFHGSAKHVRSCSRVRIRLTSHTCKLANLTNYHLIRNDYMGNCADAYLFSEPVYRLPTHNTIYVPWPWLLSSLALNNVNEAPSTSDLDLIMFTRNNCMRTFLWLLMENRLLSSFLLSFVYFLAVSFIS